MSLPGLNPGRAGGGSWTRTLTSTPSSATLAPLTGPPRNIRIDGSPAGGDEDIVGVGPTAELSWDAPDAGAPDWYEIFVSGVGAAFQQTGFAPAALLKTGRNSIVLPPPLFERHEAFVATVTSVVSPDHPLDPPYESGDTRGESDAVTSVLRR